MLMTAEGLLMFKSFSASPVEKATHIRKECVGWTLLNAVVSTLNNPQALLCGERRSPVCERSEHLNPSSLLFLFVLLLLFLFVPSANAQFLPKSEVLQNAATGTGNGTVFIVSGYNIAGVQVSGTFVGTVSFEGNIGNKNDGFSPLACTPLAGGAAVTTAVVAGIYQCPVAGLALIQARVSAYTSGSITVKSLVLLTCKDAS